MSPLSRLRRFLGLTQLDVALATGIAIGRLSRAERGLLTLAETEERLVAAYLAARMRIEAASDRASGASHV
jgi:transcriptional regulator with XRE-family HTH domain